MGKNEYVVDVVDNSGLRLYVTKNLQPIEAATITFGVPVGAMYQIVPPRQKKFVNYGYCNSECTQKLPKDGVNVFAGLLHAHLIGKYEPGRELRDHSHAVIG